MRRKPIQGFSFNGIIGLLKLLKKKRSASWIYGHAPIKFKVTLLKQIKWLVKKQYIKRFTDYKARGVRRGRTHPLRVPIKKPYVDYKITPLGLKFLEMLS